MKNLCAFLAAMHLATALGAEHGQDGSGHTNKVRLSPAAIDALVEVMRTNHPALRAQASRIRAAGHAAEGVRTWADPMLAFGGTVSDGARGPGLREDGDLVYELEQPLPLFGKAAAARDAARREAEAEEARAGVTFQTLRRDLSKLLIALAAQEESLAIGRDDLAWLETVVQVATEQQRAGGGSPTAVLKVQTELARRKDSLLTEARRQEHSLAGINRHLLRDLRQPLPAYVLPEVAPPVAYSSNLVQRAVQHEPRLLVLAAEMRAAQAQAEIARKSRLPEVGGFLEGRQYSGDGGFREATIGVKLTLPWFNGGRYRSDYARERARVDAVRFEIENAAQMIREELHQITVDLDAARREALLYRDDILPRVRVAFELARTQWLNGQVTLVEPLEARRQWLEARERLVRAIATQQQMISELVLAAGFTSVAELDSFLRGNSPGAALQPSTSVP